MGQGKLLGWPLQYCHLDKGQTVHSGAQVPQSHKQAQAKAVCMPSQGGLSRLLTQQNEHGISAAMLSFLETTAQDSEVWQSLRMVMEGRWGPLLPTNQHLIVKRRWANHTAATSRLASHSVLH